MGRAGPGRASNPLPREGTHHRACRPLPSETPPFVEALAVWGWAVEHGGIPLEYAAEVLADHPVYVEDSDVPDSTPTARWAWAAADLTDWEEILVRMDWPGDDAVDEERRDQGADWQLREFLLHILGRAEIDD